MPYQLQALNLIQKSSQARALSLQSSAEQALLK